MFLVNRNKLRGKTSKVLLANLSPFYTGLKFQQTFICKVKNIKGLVCGTERRSCCMHVIKTLFCLRTDFYGSVKNVALQLSKEDLLQSTFPVLVTGNCYIQIVLELFLSREDCLKCSNCIARLGITCLEWYLPKTRLSLQDYLTSDCLQKF